MEKIFRFVFSSGNGNSIFRSILPGLIKAGSISDLKINMWWRWWDGGWSDEMVEWDRFDKNISSLT